MSANDALVRLAAGTDEDEVLLSVVIPTYNRAEDLDRQLDDLHRALLRSGVSWEIRVHDNASTDTTPDVTARWAERIGPERFHATRNAVNTGGIPNLHDAIAGAVGRWVWSVGDDDVLHEGTVDEIVRILGDNPDLALLYLNYRGIDSVTRETTTEHYFDPAVSGRLDDGRAAFAHHAGAELGSVIFLTATVYRTRLVHAAQAAWTGDAANWALVAYWTGFVSARGPIYITPDIWIDCVVGQSHWQSEDGAWTRAVYVEIPRVFVELEHEGYPVRFCRSQGLKELRRPQPTRSGRLRSHVRALRTCPECVLTLSHLMVAGWWFTG